MSTQRTQYRIHDEFVELKSVNRSNASDIATHGTEFMDKGNAFNRSYDSYPITIVTAYFLIQKAKHSFKDYMKWIDIWFNDVQYPIVIYTNMQHMFIEHGYRANETSHPTIYVNSSISDLYIYEKYHVIYTKHHKLDPEGRTGRRSIELYVMWNSKSRWLYEVSRWNPFQSQYLIYTDIGAWRSEDKSKEILENAYWPHLYRIQKTFDACELMDKNDCVLLSMIAPFNNDVCSLFNHDHIEGGIIMGTVQSLNWWYNTFITMHDLFIENGLLVVKDQIIYGTIVLRHNVEGNNRILLLNSTTWECGDKWFYYQLFLSSSNRTVKCDEIHGFPQHLYSIEKTGSRLSLDDQYIEKLKNCRSNPARNKLP